MLLDSNILIGYLNGDEELIAVMQGWHSSGVPLYISSISAVEVLSLSALKSSDLPSVETFLAGFIVIPVDMSVVHAGGALRCAYRLTVPDAVIVATAVVHSLPLATRDKKMRAVPGVILSDI